MIKATYTPIFLKEQDFITNGFFTGTANSSQVNMAFALAEWQVQKEIGTYLTPTVITGTFSWPKDQWILQTPETRLREIKSVVLHQAYSAGVDRLISGTADIIDNDNGYFRVKPSPYDVSDCNNCGNAMPQDVYKAEIAYTVGLETGSHLLPNVQLALSLAADINLNQFADRGMAQEFENFNTTLQIGRTIMTNKSDLVMNTPFGPSGRGQYIRELLRGLKVERAGKLGV